MSSCSVVMVTFHTGPVLFASVKSVLRQELLSELIVVDNGNLPNVQARLQQMALSEPRLKIVKSGGNIGFAKATNLGAQQATGEYLLMLNPDCLLPPDALKDMIAGFAEVKDSVLAGCWLQNPDGSEQRGGRRQLLTPETALSEVFGLYRIFNMKRLNENATPMPRETHEVAAISGAFMGMRKRDFDRINGLDPEFFLHVEDLDLCMRVKQNGGKVICIPRIKVTHMRSTSGEATSQSIEWHKTKGFVRYFHKHFAAEHTSMFLWAVDAAIWARFFLRSTLGKLRDRILPSQHMSHSIAAKRLMILASGLADLPEKKDWHGKTVMVTGATSQLGLCVVRRLLASGAAVLAVSRFDPIPFRHEHLRWLKGDLTDETFHLDGYLVDIVVHCAPLWHLPETIDLLAEAEVKRVIAFGSTSVFGKALSKNTYEKEVVDKLSKAEASVADKCGAKHIAWTILRPTLIYGVGLDLNVTSIAKFIDRFGFFPVYPPAFGKRQPVHADDLAQAAILVANADITRGKSYNISGGEAITYREMLERLFALCRRKVKIIPTTLLPGALDLAGKLLGKPHINGEIARRMNDDLVFFYDDATRDFGYRPRPFLSGGMKDIEGF